MVNLRMEMATKSRFTHKTWLATLFSLLPPQMVNLRIERLCWFYQAWMVLVSVDVARKMASHPLVLRW